MSTIGTARYPKRRRNTVNYNVDLDIDIEGDEAEWSEKSGDAVTPLPDGATASAHDDSIHEEGESEAEDATYGSRKSKKRPLKKRLKNANKKAKPTPKWKPFRLLDLPAELRLKIYEEILVDPHGVYIRTYDDKYEKVAVHVSPRFIDGTTYRDRKGYVKGEWKELKKGDLPFNRYQLSPNILATCKTVHDEAVSLLWKQPFIFADVHGLLSFLLPLRPTTIARLEDITILKDGWVMGRNTPAFVLLRDAVNLKNLRFDCQIRGARDYRNASMAPALMGEKLADRFFKDCHPFLRSFMRHRGAEALIDVLKFGKEEFVHRYYSFSQTYTTEDWSEEKEQKVMEAMVNQLKVIVKRKTTPKFK
ncbi:hypothetical protein VP1G_03785 [Cytospora mali]|uniref:Uncharacterized protein n=1 Tax=Cytospora mali TaxID=578113 RepID=A0A194UXS8_CYTMA|nr:hypothetical protein VP1G_03785 [Valsa mali var. pyri (nom. inval.)]